MTVLPHAELPLAATALAVLRVAWREAADQVQGEPRSPPIGWRSRTPGRWPRADRPPAQYATAARARRL